MLESKIERHLPLTVEVGLPFCMTGPSHSRSKKLLEAAVSCLNFDWGGQAVQFNTYTLLPMVADAEKNRAARKVLEVDAS